LTKPKIKPKYKSPAIKLGFNYGATMQQRMYSIKDSKSGIYNLPFIKHSHGEAERDFMSMANDDKSVVNKYPTDFDLYYLGDYDSDSGKIEALETPQHIIKADQLLKKD